MRLGNYGFSLLELMLGLALLTLLLSMVQRGLGEVGSRRQRLQFEVVQPKVEELWQGEVHVQRERVDPYWSLHIWQWRCPDSGEVRHELKRFEWEGFQP